MSQKLSQELSQIDSYLFAPCGRSHFKKESLSFCKFKVLLYPITPFLKRSLYIQCKDQTNRRLESLKTFWTLGVTSPENFKNFAMYGVRKGMFGARHRQQATGKKQQAARNTRHETSSHEFTFSSTRYSKLLQWYAWV